MPMSNIKHMWHIIWMMVEHRGRHIYNIVSFGYNYIFICPFSNIEHMSHVIWMMVEHRGTHIM